MRSSFAMVRSNPHLFATGDQPTRESGWALDLYGRSRLALHELWRSGAFMRLSAFLACASAAPVIIAASEPVRLQPSSPWNVDYAENSCRLIRTFGEGKTRTVLMFESGAPGEMDLLLVGNPVESYSEKVAARFLPNGGKEFVGQTEQAANREPAILWSTVYLAPDAAIA